MFLFCCTLYILVRFHLLLDHIKLALLLFLFLKISTVAFVVGDECQIIKLVVIKRTIFFFNCLLNCHFHRCAVIFSHSVMMPKYRE